MVRMREIREFTRRIVEEFKPQRIILFGSYAYGRPRDGSDVDLLVVTSYRGHPVQKAVEILTRLNPPFGVDLIVRSPSQVRRRLAMQDWFMQDIVEKGKVLYEAPDARVGR
jgi:predicted nucleotidyltransferase